MESAGGEAFLGGAVAGGAEGGEEAGGLEGGEEGFVGMDFVGEAFACTLLAVVGEIGHSQILLVLVHNTENLNETIGPTCGAGPELESRKGSYYASSHQQDRKKKPRQAR